MEKVVSTLSRIFSDKSFVSFDISVRSTGWCKYEKGVLTYGSFGLKSADELGRRMEFRQHAISIIDKSYDFIAIEDVIGGCNFETTKALIQLNSIIDDLIYLGTIPKNVVHRINNVVWKKYLKEVSQYRGIKASFSKEEIHKAIEILGFTDTVVQDVYDSIGLAIGVICQSERSVVEKKRAKLHTDLSKGYRLFKYSDNKLDDLITKTGLPELNIEFDGTCRDMLQQFKQTVVDLGDDYVFVVDAQRDKYGVLALTGKLPIGNDDNRIIAVKSTKC